MYFNLVGFSATSYALVFYNGSNTVDTDYGWGPLQVKMATVTNGVVAVSAESVTLEGSSPVFDLAVAQVDANTAVIAYSDYNNNFGINTVLLEVQGTTPSKSF